MSVGQSRIKSIFDALRPRAHAEPPKINLELVVTDVLNGDETDDIIFDVPDLPDEVIAFASLHTDSNMLPEENERSIETGEHHIPVAHPSPEMIRVCDGKFA